MSTLRARVTGLAGVAGILLIVAGAPAVLLAIGATPFPDGVPSWHEIVTTLTGVDDGSTTLALFRLAAWAAWAYLAAGLLLELTWRARGITAPSIRGLGLSQSVGKALVSAAVLLFTAAPAATIATSAAAAPVVHAAATRSLALADLSTSEAAFGSGDGQVAGATTAPVEEARQPVTVHTVRPGETLWAIAERYLGDGARYAEIAQANYGAPQPGGAALTSSHWIRPGWTLHIPTPDATDNPATSVEEYTVRPGDTMWDIAADELGDPTRYGEIYQASTRIAQPGGHRLTDPDEISPGWTLHLPTTDSTPPAATPTTAQPAPPEPAPDEPAPAPPVDDPTNATQPESAPAAPPAADAAPIEATGSGDQSATAEAGEATQAGDSEEIGSWPVRTAAGVGSLLAAGVVALIAARRAARARNRQPGQATAMPTGQTADLERELRATSDPLGIDAVDTALRGLAAACTRTGQPLPTLRWARLSPSQLDLHLAQPAQLPDPWTGTTDALTWTLHVDHAAEADPDALATVPAPYPALVTLGHDLDDGHVMIDLEHLGALAVVGDKDRTRDVLAALAVELATSAWADDLRVTTVLGHVGLEDALQTGRIRYRPSVGHLLDDLTARAAADRTALSAAGAPDLPHARITGAAPDAWAPEVLLLACHLTDRHRNLLATLVEEQPRVAVAAVTADDQVSEWTLTLTDDVAVLDPVGLRLRPQRLDPVVYERILELVTPTTGSQPEGSPTNGESIAESGTNDAADTEPKAALADEPPAAPGTLPTTSDQRDRNGVQPVGRSQAPLPPTGRQGAETLPMADDDTATPAATVPAPTKEPTEPVGSGEARASGVSDPDRPHADPAPFIRVLGLVTIEHARGSVEQSRRSRLTEYAAYLALHPGATAAAIDEAIWPHRRREDNQTTRHTATSRLRAWLGEDPEGNPYLPVHQGTRYAFQRDVRTDWDDWRALLPDGPLRATSEDLERALSLVRGRPFDGAHPRRYAWAEPIRRTMIDQIVDAAHELARHQASEGNWRGAEDAVVIGLALDPALERLWRVRILAAHANDANTAGAESIERMLTVTDDLGGDLEPETEDLLAAIRQGADLDELTAIAL